MFCKSLFKDSCENMLTAIRDCDQNSITDKRFLVLETVLLSGKGNKYIAIRGYDNEPDYDELVEIAESIYEEKYRADVITPTSSDACQKDHAIKFIIDTLVVVDSKQRTYKAGI